MEDREILLRNAMEHHGAAVYRLALCRMQSIQDAEDVYQDVFLRLLDQEASAWDAEHLRAWLLRCTVCGGRCWPWQICRRWKRKRTAAPSCGTRWPACRRSSGSPFTCTMPRGIPQRRSPGCWTSRRPRSAPGSAGPGTD